MRRDITIAAAIVAAIILPIILLGILANNQDGIIINVASAAFYAEYGDWPRHKDITLSGLPLLRGNIVTVDFNGDLVTTRHTCRNMGREWICDRGKAIFR